MKRVWIIGAALVCLAQAGAARNACELLTPKDLAFVRAKESHSTRDALTVTQCFYELPSFTNSVSVMMMTASDDEIRRWWAARVETKHEEEHEAETIEVDGVGREAVWSGNKLVGSLYVLDRGVILRISPGGAGTAKEKIARSKALARIALRRYRS
jgi:hypothetical protein